MRYETFECDICHAKNNHLHNGDENNIMLQAYVDDHSGRGSGRGGNWEDDGNYECCRECYEYVKDVISERISANQQ